VVTQLKYQNPMQPMDDKEFISQLAQFNSLEQMQNLNDSMSAFLELGQITRASSLIGKTVTATKGGLHRYHLRHRGSRSA